MTAQPDDHGETIGILRQVDMLMAQGLSLDGALKAADASQSDYIDWRADYAGLPARQVRRLYAAGGDNEPVGDPKTYIGKPLSGLCPVCGQTADFVDFQENLRESGRCLICSSSNRQRQMAYMTRLCLGLPINGALTLPRGLDILNTESTGAVHGQLRNHAGYTFSEYWGEDFAPGQVVDGVRHEDLQNLSFADNSLDLVLSSDVLEHMPYPYHAHAEVFRVLKPGGRHIFTVPFHGGYEDNVRAKLEGGEISYFGEKLYHGDPIRPEEGVLVWTIFGTEMLDRLRDIGFHALMWKFSAAKYGIVDDAIVFDARKPGAVQFDTLQPGAAPREAWLGLPAAARKLLRAIRPSR